MHVPLIAAVIRKEVVDYAVKARPVRSVIGVSSLRPRDGDMRLTIALYDSVACRLIGPPKSNLHESAVVRPGSEATDLARLLSCIGNDVVPVFEIRPPLFVQRGQSAVFVFQPAAEFRQSSRTPIKVGRVAVRGERALITYEVVVHVIACLVPGGGAHNVGQRLQKP